MELLQEGSPLPGPETELLSSTWKWVVRGDACADKARDFIGKGHPGAEQEGEGTQENCSVALSLGFYGDGISFQVVFSQSFWLRVLPGGARLIQLRWMPVRIQGGGWTCGVSFWPFPNSSGWGWLTTKVRLVKAMVFPVVLYGCESWTVKKAKKLMLLNYGVGEDSWESLGLQGDPTSPFWRRSVLGVRWKDWCWSWNSSTLATSCEELTHWKGPWCWEGLGAGGGGDNRGWDGWMASPTQWAGVWVNSGSWWWTGRPGELHFMGSQRVGHDWATELNYKFCLPYLQS